MGLAGKYVALIDEIIVQLKTITPELTDDTTVNGGPRVIKWADPRGRSPRKGRFEAEVKAGPMSIIGGKTTNVFSNPTFSFQPVAHYPILKIWKDRL